ALQPFGALADKVIDQFRGRVLHFNAKARHLVGEVVEQPHSGNRHSDTECRSHEGLSDSSTDSTDTGTFTLSECDESTDDADDRSEQSDERSCRSDSGEARKAALELSGLNRDSTLEGTLRSFHLIGSDLAARMSTEFLKARRNDHSEVRIFVLIADADSLVNIAVFQSLGNFRGVLPRLLLCLVIGEPTFDTDRDQIYRLDQQRDDHDPTRDGQTCRDIIDTK